MTSNLFRKKCFRNLEKNEINDNFKYSRPSMASVQVERANIEMGSAI